VQVPIRRGGVISAVTSISQLLAGDDEPDFRAGKKRREAQRQPAPGGNAQSPQLFGQMQLSGVDIDGNFMPFDMQPSQLAMNFNGMSSTLQGSVIPAGANQSER
jgi:hypothetical protein